MADPMELPEDLQHLIEKRERLRRKQDTADDPAEVQDTPPTGEERRRQQRREEDKRNPPPQP